MDAATRRRPLSRDTQLSTFPCRERGRRFPTPLAAVVWGVRT